MILDCAKSSFNQQASIARAFHFARCAVARQLHLPTAPGCYGSRSTLPAEPFPRHGLQPAWRAAAAWPQGPQARSAQWAMECQLLALIQCPYSHDLREGGLGKIRWSFEARDGQTFQVTNSAKPKGKNQRRRRLRLDDESWFKDRLRQHGLLNLLDGPCVAEELEIIAVILASSGAACSSPAQTLSQEASLQMRFFKGPADGIVLHVREAWVLDQPLRVHRGSVCSFKPACGAVVSSRFQCRLQRSPSLVLASATALGARARLAGCPASAPIALLEVLSRLHAQCGAHGPTPNLSEVQGLLVVEPIAQLVARSAWRDLLVLGRWGLRGFAALQPGAPTLQ